MIHSGELLPFLLYLAGNSFEYMYNNLSIVDVGVGFGIGNFFGSKNYVLISSSYAYINSIDYGEVEGFGVSLGILSDFSFGNLGLYVFSEIGITFAELYTIPFQAMQIGVRYSF